MWSQARATLQRYFDFPDFRPGQREAVRSILHGNDTLVVMPTGGGKSLCYQVPALLLPGLTIVVSPLIALMLDQVGSLQRRGIPSALVNSTLSEHEIGERLERAIAGQIKLLYVAPERFGSRAFRRALARMRIGMVAIDEAHCVCEWGHDFRPSYLALRRHWNAIGRPRLLALTATATPEVREEIVRELDLKNARVIVRGFDRPNLLWCVHREERLSAKCRALVSMLGPPNESAVVYASTRKMVESVTELLVSRGFVAGGYHAGLTKQRRSAIQADWTSGRVPIVVATNAFGMGIDKADVRRVIHFQMPGSLEAYYQEAGRAGRDGEPAQCILLHSYRDRFTHEFFIRSSYPPRKIVEAVYAALRNLSRSEDQPVPFDRLARTARGAKSEGEVRSALRILTDIGAVEDTRARNDCLVRWIAGAGRVSALVADLDGAGELESQEGSGPAAARELVLARLARATACGKRRSLRLSRQELARWAGGDLAAARSGLDELQRLGVLGWRDEGRRQGFLLTDASLAPGSLELDWEGVRARRNLERRKLRRMEVYCFQRGCRRRYLLRYFGERVSARRCGGCDRCGWPG